MQGLNYAISYEKLYTFLINIARATSAGRLSEARFEHGKIWDERVNPIIHKRVLYKSIKNIHRMTSTQNMP